MRNPEAARGRVVKRNRTLGTGDLGVTAARGLSTCRSQNLVRRVAVEHDALAGGESPAYSTSFAACSVPSALPCGPTEPSPSKSPAASPHIAPAKDPRTDRLTPADRLLWVWLARSWRGGGPGPSPRKAGAGGPSSPPRVGGRARLGEVG